MYCSCIPVMIRTTVFLSSEGRSELQGWWSLRSSWTSRRSSLALKRISGAEEARKWTISERRKREREKKKAMAMQDQRAALDSVQKAVVADQFLSEPNRRKFHLNAALNNKTLVRFKVQAEELMNSSLKRKKNSDLTKKICQKKLKRTVSQNFVRADTVGAQFSGILSDRHINIFLYLGRKIILLRINSVYLKRWRFWNDNGIFGNCKSKIKTVIVNQTSNFSHMTVWQNVHQLYEPMLLLWLFLCVLMSCAAYFVLQIRVSKNATSRNANLVFMSNHYLWI